MSYPTVKRFLKIKIKVCEKCHKEFEYSFRSRPPKKCQPCQKIYTREQSKINSRKHYHETAEIGKLFCLNCKTWIKGKNVYDGKNYNAYCSVIGRETAGEEKRPCDLPIDE